MVYYTAKRQDIEVSMDEVLKMLEVIGDGNSSTKLFIASIKEQIKSGKQLSTKQVLALRKIHHFASKGGAKAVVVDEPETTTTVEPVTLQPHSGEVVIDESCRLYFHEKAFGNAEYFRVLRFNDDTLFIHPYHEKTRRSRKDNPSYPSCHSLSIKTEYYMMNKRVPSSPIGLKYTMNDKGMFIDLGNIERYVFFDFL